jgi:hypothetical protein
MILKPTITLNDEKIKKIVRGEIRQQQFNELDEIRIRLLKIEEKMIIYDKVIRGDKNETKERNRL